MLSTLAALTPSANADPPLTLSSPNDLSHLTVGQTVEIDVSLQGLAVGSDFIFVLNSEVLFPSSNFTPIPDAANSSGLTPGEIFIATPASQTSNFNSLSSLNPDNTTGKFSDSTPTSSAAINANGLYYSFQLQATSAGSGFIQFNPVATTYADTDTGFNLVPLPIGGPLPFTINAVPEPTSLAMLGLGALLELGHARSRKADRFRSSRA